MYLIIYKESSYQEINQKNDDVPLYLEKQLAKLLTELEELGEEQN